MISGHRAFSSNTRQAQGSAPRSAPRCLSMPMPTAFLRLACTAHPQVLHHRDHSSPSDSQSAHAFSAPRSEPRFRTRCSGLPEKGAGGGGKQEVDPTSLEAAADTMEIIWDLACRRDEDALLAYFPDAVLEQAAQLRHRMERGDPEDASDGLESTSGLGSETNSKSKSQQQQQPQPQQRQQQQQQSQDRRPVTLRDVVIQAHGMTGFAFDSFAVRHLYVSPPTRGSVRRLSCIRTAPVRAVARYAVAEEGGERAVLTFGLECEERLAPHYRSARVEYVWQLVAVTGEAMEPEPEMCLGPEGVGREEAAAAAAEAVIGGSQPHPSLPPEAVIGAQLEALAREDVAAVFAFASPANKAVTGPLERFTALFQNPVYRPLLRHRAAEPLHMASRRPGHHSAVVKIISANTGMPQEVEMVFYWKLSRQAPDAEAHANCWMTDSVELVSARPLGRGG
ncbi:hypothetical protein PLESTF_000134100 [Pleodorina starrii]|nr:hypothetical protein PLESTM_000016100 [Pleodorina starrii]GLC64189.1 hypothetical protein PLESTF_000134100 [Pleodorina starrii]